jgi:uncharacterized Zn-finger protein
MPAVLSLFSPFTTYFSLIFSSGSALFSGRKHVCDFCGRGFKQGSHLKEHARIHTDEKVTAFPPLFLCFSFLTLLCSVVQPFVCDACGRAFSRKNYLLQHNRIHTGEKRFVCEICETAFRQSATLIRHMKTHGRRKKTEKKQDSKSRLSRAGAGGDPQHEMDVEEWY